MARLPFACCCLGLMVLVSMGCQRGTPAGDRQGPAGTEAQVGEPVTKEPTPKPAPAPKDAEAVYDGKPLSAWMALLKGADTQEREKAGRVLTHLGQPAVPALLDALKDQNPAVRSQAASILGQIGPDAKSAAPGLIEATKDADLLARRTAALALARVSPEEIKASATVLLDLMRANADPWGGEKGQAALFASDDLARLGPRAVPLLVEALGDPNPTLRRNAAATLGKMGSDAKEAVNALAKALEDKDVKVRVAVAASLARLSPEHSKVAIDVLVKAIKDNDDSAVLGRYAAIAALGELGPLAKPAAPALASLASQGFGDPLERAATAALEKIRAEPKVEAGKGSNIWEEVIGPGAGDAVGPLVRRLKEGDPKSRQDAASDLAKMGPKAKDAVPALSAALKDPDPAVVKLAAGALAKTGEPGIPPLVLGMQDEDETLRGICADALSEAGQPAVPALIKLLRSPNKTTVSTACATLGKVGTPAIPGLVTALKDDDPQVRGFALLALGQMGTSAKEALPAVRALLNDNHPGVRRAAADVVQKISP